MGFSEAEIIDIARSVSERTTEKSKFAELIQTPVGDDCFTLKKTDIPFAITTDMLVENVHFDLSFFSYADVGYRSVAVNISDLASQGAEPAFIFLSLGIPENTVFAQIKEFFRGIEDACLEFGCILAGGDTNRASFFTVNITALGFVQKEMRRDKAKPGESICVTGSIGKAFAGYFIYKNRVQLHSFREIATPFLRPAPRVHEAIKIASCGVKCCEDISDGLVRDLKNICMASGVGAEIYLEKLPLSEEIRKIAQKFKEIDLMKEALTFGDDYELLFTADNRTIECIKESGISDFTVIGKITESTEIHFIDDRGNLCDFGEGYLHKF